MTGSAHAVLAPFWQARLSGQAQQTTGRRGGDEGAAAGVGGGGGNGAATMTARQCSPRGGDLAVRVEAGRGRVVVSGQAVVVIRGTMQVA